MSSYIVGMEHEGAFYELEIVDHLHSDWSVTRKIFEAYCDGAAVELTAAEQSTLIEAYEERLQGQ